MFLLRETSDRPRLVEATASGQPNSGVQGLVAAPYDVGAFTPFQMEVITA